MCCSLPSYRVGHNEVIGVCRVGNEAESLGRDHWNEMLTYPRKPIAHWHLLIEVWPPLYVSVVLSIDVFKLYVGYKVYTSLKM